MIANLRILEKFLPSSAAGKKTGTFRESEFTEGPASMHVTNLLITIKFMIKLEVLHVFMHIKLNV